MTTDTVSEELKPCPFCGSADITWCGYLTNSMLRCNGCGTTSDDGSKVRIRAKWNRRSTLPAERVPEELADMEARKDAAYLERNQVVAALAAAFPSGIARTAIPGWSEDWHGCVYIDLPTGQASWHYHDSHAHLFAHLPPYTGQWDGHTTDEKYERLARLMPRTAGALDEPKTLRWRKKPVVIEAMQFVDGASMQAILEWSDYQIAATGTRKPIDGVVTPHMEIETLEGQMVANVGDWIIKGVKGEFYPCKPDIFAATYEPVGSSAPLSAGSIAQDHTDGGWKPIESAPKDGTEILLYGISDWGADYEGPDARKLSHIAGHGKTGRAIGKWQTDELYGSSEGWWRTLTANPYCDYVIPTHWMPLPSPPSEKG